VNFETMRRAADDFLSQFESLAAEVITLHGSLAEAQAENSELQAELGEAVTLLRNAQASVAGGEPAKRGRGRAFAAPPAASRTRARSASSNGDSGTRAPRASNGRATPESVTPGVVRAVIGKLGSATAGEIAAQISTAGAPVSGRAIRHIARGAGAVMRPGDDGRMVYSLSWWIAEGALSGWGRDDHLRPGHELIPVDHLPPERGEGEACHLEGRNPEGDADDGEAEQDAGDQVCERQPEPAEDEPEHIAEAPQGHVAIRAIHDHSA
jgi:hypothetical protein